MAKKRDWNRAQHTKSDTTGAEAWWYGQPNSIWVGISLNGITLSAKIYRRDIEAWLKEVRPK